MAALYPVLARPESRGQVRLDPAGPDTAARIEFNFLSDERDLRRMIDAFRLAASILAAPEMDPLCDEAFILARPAGLMKYNVPSKQNALRGALAAGLLDFVRPLGKALIARVAQTRPIHTLVGDEAELAAWVRRATVGAGHVSGTCRIGLVSDPLAVVDPAGRVHGIAGLRVADASVMPCVPSGNTHIPTIMVAEKIAAGIIAEGL